MIPRPDLFIIGAPKSGTSSLYEYLAGHPEVFMSAVKEPGYFSPDVPSPRRRFTYGEDEAKYLALFEDASNAKRIGEASTYYLFSRRAPALVGDFSPDARLIAIVRNPVDMAYAMHSQRLEHGNETITDFGAALAADELPDRGGATRAATINRGGSYLERARYADQLTRWLEVFPRQQLLVLIFDDFVADTPASFRQVLQFLDVDPSWRPEEYDPRNTSHRIKRGVVPSLLRSAPVRWVRHRALPAIIGRDASARLGRQVKHSGLVRDEKRREPIAPDLRLRMEEQLTEDVSRLGDMLGRNLVAEWFAAQPASPSGAAGNTMAAR